MGKPSVEAIAGLDTALVRIENKTYGIDRMTGERLYNVCALFRTLHLQSEVKEWT